VEKTDRQEYRKLKTPRLEQNEMWCERQ